MNTPPNKKGFRVSIRPYEYWIPPDYVTTLREIPPIVEEVNQGIPRNHYDQWHPGGYWEADIRLLFDFKVLGLIPPDFFSRPIVNRIYAENPHKDFVFGYVVRESDSRVTSVAIEPDQPISLFLRKWIGE